MSTRDRGRFRKNGASAGWGRWMAVTASVVLAYPLGLSAAENDERGSGPAGSRDDRIEAAAARAESAAAEARALLDEIGRGETGEGSAPGSKPASSPDAGSEAEDGEADESQESAAGAGAGEGEGQSGLNATDSEALRRALEDVDAAAQEARSAAEEARAVANAARAEMQAYRERFARTGPFLGVAGLYAVEDFDASGADVDNGFGGAVFAGYRVHSNVSIEVRGEYLEGFDIEPPADAGASFRDAELDGFLITAGPKIYPFTGSLQPFVGLGIGVMRGELEGRRVDGTRFGDRATDAVIRPAAGLDFFVSENLVLNVEAAYVSPGGNLENLDFASFSSGLTFRF